MVYCYSRSKTEEYAKIILNQEITQIPNSPDLDIFLSHIANLYGTDWIVYQCLQQGIGIHHGMLPKYIQKETINLFNAGVLKILLCTTTITEGVNTTAKNLIVLNSKKGEKPLKPFDAKNSIRLVFSSSGKLSKDSLLMSSNRLYIVLCVILLIFGVITHLLVKCGNSSIHLW